MPDSKLDRSVRRESGARTPEQGLPTVSRRWALGWGLAVVAGAGLSACGFELRRPPNLLFKRIHVTGWLNTSPLSEELRRQLLANPGVELLESEPGADVVLQILEDRRDELVAVSSGYGQVRELTLRQRLRFSARAPQGAVLIPPTELFQQRDLSYSETNALAKESEALMLYRSISADFASQVVRRLATISLGAVGAAASVPAAASAAAPAR